MLIKPDWKKFKAKFSDNPQDNFEWFCYMLFCKEFSKASGIFRFKNQSAIETNPVEKEGKIIGWQAKFYDKALSDHKTDLINTLEKAKRDYPNITKLILYTNQEWGQNKGKESQGKKEIEEKSKTLGIELEWRTASFFESPFVSIDNEIIAKYFFSLDKSAFNLIKDQQTHTKNILNGIQTCIIFNGQNIKLDRSKDLEKIKTNLEQVLILSGGSGVGKTALIKEFYEQINKKTPFYIFKASEFELRNINDFFTGYNFQDFLEVHKDEDNKIIVIDSAEKLLDLNNSDPFKEILGILIQKKWIIIFTTRDNYLEDLNYQFFEIYRIAPLNINIQNLATEELNIVSEQYRFTLPADGKLLEFIKNPFYLSEYLKFYKENDEINYIDFKEKLWNKIIQKAKPAREQCFLSAALERANNGQFFINPNCESQILDNELKKDGILGYESPHGYFITHDIYEEWALEKIIEAGFKKKTDNKTFFQNIGSSLPVRRAFRKWVSEKLLLEDSEIKNFIEEILKSSEVDSFWKDEILVSISLSDYSERFYEIFKKELFADNQHLLRKISFLLRIACKEVDNDLFKQLGIKDLNLLSLKYVLTKPKGQGWQSLIKFVFENLDTIGIQNIYFVLQIIHDWASKFKVGETTRYSGLIALRYYQWIIKEDVYSSRDEAKEHLLQTIIYSSSEIKTELEEIFKEILQNKWKKPKDPYYDLSKIILTRLEGISISKILPIYVLQLADLFWSFTPKENKYYSHSGIGVNQYFNMEDEYSDYFPSSSYQTPIYWLLQFSMKETIDFILTFTNKTVEYFAKSDFAKYEVEAVEVFIVEKEPIKQYISDMLWCTYRGTQVSSHILESMHMALEKFFLENG
ncbi:MAG: ATP-binding protein, partial [bacterium]